MKDTPSLIKTRRWIRSYSAAIAIAVAVLVVFSCRSVNQRFYGENSAFDPTEIIRDLDNGTIHQGIKDWAQQSDRHIAKPFEFHEAAGVSDSSKTYYRRTEGKRQWVEVRYEDYHFSYARFQKGPRYYSFYEKDDVLFAVYEWDRTKRSGAYRFNDEALMREYLDALEVGYAENNVPITYAVPEALLTDVHRGTGGGGKVYSQKITEEEALRIGIKRQR